MQPGEIRSREGHFSEELEERVSSVSVIPLCHGLLRRNHGGGVRACHGRLCSISTEIHLVAQCRQSHWSTNEGLGCGDVCESAIYSNDAVKLEKISRPTGGCVLLYEQEDRIRIQSGL